MIVRGYLQVFKFFISLFQTSTSANWIFILVIRPHLALIPLAHTNVHAMKVILEMDMNVHQKVSLNRY